MKKKKLSEKQKRAVEAKFERYCRNVIKKAAREIYARNDQKKAGN